MNMENFTSVFNSADGPTSIFVAGKTPEIMGVLIAIVVVGVIISLFGLKLVRVLSAMMGLGTGAVIGAVIGTVAGLDMTKMVATIAVCGVVLCIMCAVLRKFGIYSNLRFRASVFALRYRRLSARKADRARPLENGRSALLPRKIQVQTQKRR